MVVNSGDNVAAPITIRVRDVSGNILGQDNTQVIPPNGFFNVDDLLISLNITSNYGPLEIVSTNNVPLIVVSRVYSLNDHTSGFFQGVSIQ
jgi:hypothetical protein